MSGVAGVGWAQLRVRSTPPSSWAAFTGPPPRPASPPVPGSIRQLRLKAVDGVGAGPPPCVIVGRQAGFL